MGRVTSIEAAPDEPPSVDCPNLPPRPWVITGCPKALNIVTILPDPGSRFTIGRFVTVQSTKIYVQGSAELRPASIADVLVGSRVRAWFEDRGSEVEWIGGGGLVLVILPRL